MGDIVIDVFERRASLSLQVFMFFFEKKMEKYLYFKTDRSLPDRITHLQRALVATDKPTLFIVLITYNSPLPPSLLRSLLENECSLSKYVTLHMKNLIKYTLTPHYPNDPFRTKIFIYNAKSTTLDLVLFSKFISGIQKYFHTVIL